MSLLAASPRAAVGPGQAPRRGHARGPLRRHLRHDGPPGHAVGGRPHPRRHLAPDRGRGGGRGRALRTSGGSRRSSAPAATCCPGRSPAPRPASRTRTSSRAGASSPRAPWPARTPGLSRAWRRVAQAALALTVVLTTSRAILAFALAAAIRGATTPARRRFAGALAAVLVVAMRGPDRRQRDLLPAAALGRCGCATGPSVRLQSATTSLRDARSPTRSSAPAPAPRPAAAASCPSTRTSPRSTSRRRWGCPRSPASPSRSSPCGARGRGPPTSPPGGCWPASASTASARTSRTSATCGWRSASPTRAAEARGGAPDAPRPARGGAPRRGRLAPPAATGRAAAGAACPRRRCPP